ncbi:MAG: zinc-ribbon domain-containing protein [Clostridia bacterium]|nr:zinc-ribbon domain-containing protein [Clostridia bacterium]
MKCIHCGLELISGAKFCNHCGQPVKIEEPQAQAQPQPQPQSNEQTEYQAPQGNFNPYYTPGFNGAMPPQPPLPAFGMGIAGMILGIVSLVIFCAWYLAIPCAVTGLVLSVLSMNKAKAIGRKNNMALAGFICSIVALSLALLTGILVLADLLTVTFYY